MTSPPNAFTASMALRELHEQNMQANADNVQNTWDSLHSALTQSASTGVPLSDVAAAAGDTANTANQAHSLGTSHAAILAVRDNNPLWASPDPTAEVTFPLESAVLSPSFGSTTALMGFMCVSQDKTIGRIDVPLVIGTGTISAFYINVYILAGGNWQNVYTSPDLHSQISTTGTSGWVSNVLSGPSQFAVHAGDMLAIEGVMTGSGTLAYAVKKFTTGYNTLSPHPSFVPAAFAASRDPTGNLSPATISGATVAANYNNANIPYYSIGVTGLPPTYQPDKVYPFTTAGAFTFTIPSWMVAGDAIDAVSLGAGGSGAPSNVSSAPGGNPGSFVTRKLICGTDFPVPVTTETITGVVGAGGAVPTAYRVAGNTGGSSSFTYTDPTSTPHTVTAPGGTGGPAGSNHANTTGFGPGTIVFDGYSYPGGVDTYGYSNPGSPPGGGGSGAGVGQFGGPGADGAVWFITRQA